METITPTGVKVNKDANDVRKREAGEEERDDPPDHEGCVVCQRIKPSLRGKGDLFATCVYPSRQEQSGFSFGADDGVGEPSGKPQTAELGFVVVVERATNWRVKNLEVGVRCRRGRERDRQSGPGEFHRRVFFRKYSRGSWWKLVAGCQGAKER